MNELFFLNIYCICIQYISSVLLSDFRHFMSAASWLGLSLPQISSTLFIFVIYIKCYSAVLYSSEIFFSRIQFLFHSKSGRNMVQVYTLMLMLALYISNAYVSFIITIIPLHFSNSIRLLLFYWVGWQFYAYFPNSSPPLTTFSKSFIGLNLTNKDLW